MSKRDQPLGPMEYEPPKGRRLSSGTTESQLDAVQDRGRGQAGQKLVIPFNENGLRESPTTSSATCKPMAQRKSAKIKSD